MPVPSTPLLFLLLLTHSHVSSCLSCPGAYPYLVLDNNTYSCRTPKSNNYLHVAQVCCTSLAILPFPSLITLSLSSAFSSSLPPSLLSSSPLCLLLFSSFLFFSYSSSLSFVLTPFNHLFPQCLDVNHINNISTQIRLDNNHISTSACGNYVYVFEKREEERRREGREERGEERGG